MPRLVRPAERVIMSPVDAPMLQLPQRVKVSEASEVVITAIWSCLLTEIIGNGRDDTAVPGLKFNDPG